MESVTVHDASAEGVVRWFQDGPSLEAAAGPWLAANEVDAAFAIAWREEVPGPSSGAPAALWGPPGSPAAIATRRPEREILLELADADAGAGIARAWLDRGEGCDAPGVVGPEAGATAFAETWLGRPVTRADVVLELRLHALERLAAPRDVAGRMRTAGPDDEGLVLAWGAAFAEEVGLPEHERMMAGRRSRALEEGRMRLWMDGSGRPVGSAQTGRATPTTESIAFVYTPPAHRRRGYAAAVTAAVAGEVLARGRRPILFTDRHAAGPNRLYASLGFRPRADWRHVRLARD